jgi:hypothetical protein
MIGESRHRHPENRGDAAGEIASLIHFLSIRRLTILSYLVPSLSITPGSAIGGLLWKIRPQTPFIVAGIFGILGTVLFAGMVKGQPAR